MREFKYYPDDFGELPVYVKHMDLTFDVFEEKTIVDSIMTVVSKKDIFEVVLNAKNLEIHAVSVSTGDSTFSYDGEFLKIHISNPIPVGAEFNIFTKTTCRPTKNILEGLYYDETPKACPCQMITQCQQWGFQRIVPCFDDMTAKCTYRTKIIADIRYTHLLSNGDVSIPRANLKRATIVYDNIKTPMAPYLFFLGVGTYDGFTRTVEYANGNSFTIELLTFPGADSVAAVRALDVLHDAIQWVNIFTGSTMYDNLEQKREIWSLIEKRNQLPEGQEKENIRNTLKSLSGILTGYQYTGSVYREIAMQNSNFGGMENVGNTTISANRIMPYNDMTDGAFEYMMLVKVHEFYHNLNGSEVTGRSPFEIWLNEAVTVHMERAFHAFVMGENYARLSDVLSLVAPGATLDQDMGAASMPIEPEGFNDPNELITAVTYKKAPEFVRMIEVLLGKDVFSRALAKYHAKFTHSNASRSDWVQAMSDEFGQDLSSMAQGWLKQKKYPTIDVVSHFENNVLTINLHQKGFSERPWEFPFIVRLCDADGIVYSESKTFVRLEKETITFENVSKPAFISLDPTHTVYGKIVNVVTDQELFAQASKDLDLVNRYLAFYKLADREKMRVLLGQQVSDSFLDLYYKYLTDTTLLNDLGGLFLVITDGVEDPKYAYQYEALYQTRKKIRLGIAKKYSEVLKKIYSVDSPKYTSYLKNSVAQIKYRQIKNLCLGLLAELDTPEIHAIIKEQYFSAQAVTDKIVALKLYLDSSAPDRLDVLLNFELSATNPVRFESFLSVIGRCEQDDVILLIRTMMQKPSFRIEQANDQRALLGSFAYNKRKSLLTQEGRLFIAEIISLLTPINEYVCTSILKIFGDIDKIDREHHTDLIHVLYTQLKKIDSKKYPSVYNTIRRLLIGAPVAWKAYKEIFPEANYE